MENKSLNEAIANSLKKLDLNLSTDSKPKYPLTFTIPSSRFSVGELRPPSLVSLCLGILGRHLEDIIPELGDIASTFPADIKAAVAAIARRRKLLCNEVLVSLADSSWEILDISGSDVSDSGLAKVAEICKHLRAVDISCCHKITPLGVAELVQHCRSLETLKCGGCPRGESTARKCLSMFKPNLNHIEGESWEELDALEIGHGGQSLRWLVWPKIDKDSLDMLSMECPRITVNPKPSLFGLKGTEVPREALPNITMDEPFVKDIDPKTWLISGVAPKPMMSSSPSNSNELSIAEKFRLAFVERDARLAPKRAKNARQHQRRAERDWTMSSTRAKAMAWASQASRSLSRN